MQNIRLTEEPELVYFDTVYKNRIPYGYSDTVKFSDSVFATTHRVSHRISESLLKFKEVQRSAPLTSRTVPAKSPPVPTQSQPAPANPQPTPAKPQPSALDVTTQKKISNLACDISAANSFEQLFAAYDRVCQLPEHAQQDSRTLIEKRLSEAQAGKTFKASNAAIKVRLVNSGSIPLMLAKPGYRKLDKRHEIQGEHAIQYCQMHEAILRLLKSEDPLEIRMCYITVQDFGSAAKAAHDK